MITASDPEKLDLPGSGNFGGVPACQILCSNCSKFIDCDTFMRKMIKNWK